MIIRPIYPVSPHPHRLVTLGMAVAVAERDPAPCPACGASDGCFVDRPPMSWSYVSMPVLTMECRQCRSHYTTHPERHACLIGGRGVYFIECCGFVKIGLTDDVSYRLRSLLSQNPHELKPLAFLPILSDPSEVERGLHILFDHLHHRDEWYRGAPELYGWIRENAIQSDVFFRSVRHKWCHSPRWRQ